VIKSQWHSKISKKICLFLILFNLLLNRQIRANDDLEEAAPLLQTNTADATDTIDATHVPTLEPAATLLEESKTKFENRTRAYLLIEVNQKKSEQKTAIREDTRIYFPNAEASITTEVKATEKLSVFADGIGNYSDENKNSSEFINQLGVRGPVDSNWQWAIGKERNRRSPGMLITPSDIIYSQSNLPGQREDRRGVWLSRLSYQDTVRSFDIYLMPVDNEWGNGMPRPEQGRVGLAFRIFQQLENLDLSLSIGKVHNLSKVGLSFQGLIDNVYRLYSEFGYQESSKLPNNAEKSKPHQNLFGVSYEGSNDFRVKVEYLLNGQGLNPMMSSFLRQKNLLLNVVFPEIKKRYNIISTAITSLEDSSSLQLLRGEYITNDHLLAGFSVLEISGKSGSQYYYRNFNRELTFDFKFTF
jgi:hypothetical protein